MRILNYKRYNLINEANEDEIRLIDQQIKQMEQAEQQFSQIDEEDMESIVEELERQTAYPEQLRKAMIIGIKAVYYKEIRDVYLKLFLAFKEELESGKSLQEVQHEQEIKQIGEELINLMVQKLNIDRKDLETILGKYVSGAIKYKQSLADASVVSPSDPYGEEAWDDVTDEERIRRAFEE